MTNSLIGKMGSWWEWQLRWGGGHHSQSDSLRCNKQTDLPPYKLHCCESWNLFAIENKAEEREGQLNDIPIGSIKSDADGQRTTSRFVWHGHWSADNCWLMINWNALRTTWNMMSHRERMSLLLLILRCLVWSPTFYYYQLLLANVHPTLDQPDSNDEDNTKRLDDRSLLRTSKRSPSCRCCVFDFIMRSSFAE